MRFDIRGTLPGLNEHIAAINKNRYAGNSLKKNTQELILWQIPKRLPAYNKVHIDFIWIEKDRKRDKDNIAFAKKYILDALVSRGIIKNDGWKNVESFTDTFKVDSSRPGVIVEITEVLK